MITLKELKYVGCDANNTPMPGEEYSLEVLREIKQCYELYKEKYMNKEYNMILSNAEEINFKIYFKNLCHMMGIDQKSIKEERFDQYRENILGTSSNDMSSFQLLELILEHMEEVARADNNPNITTRAINYYKSAIKCAIFNKFSNFEKFNFAVINYVGYNPKYNYENEKMFFIPSNEGLLPYFIMQIVKDRKNYKKDEEDNSNDFEEDASNNAEEDSTNKTEEDSTNKTEEDSTNKTEGNYRNIFVVKSLLAPCDPKKYFENQEVVIPTQILLSNNEVLSKHVASAEEKIQLFTMYQNIINKYQIPNRLNIYGDYESILNDIVNQRVLRK